MKRTWPIVAAVVLSITGIVSNYMILNKPVQIDTKLKHKVADSNQINRNIENKKETLKKGIIEKKEEEPEPILEPTPTPTPEPTPTPDPIVHDGLTMTELSNKLDRTLHSTLSGYGSLFANHSLKLGIDPYLAVAIVMYETGCKWTCSTLVRQCNNVGGMKGSPGCGGGSYKAFPTLEEGIQSYLDNLYNNYYRVGLVTPEAIGPKYAENVNWASNIHSYMGEIKAK